MNYGALFRSALVTLLRNKMRSILTVLGITIGIAAVICVVAIGNALIQHAVKGRDHESALPQRGRQIAKREAIDLGYREPRRGPDRGKLESPFDARLDQFMVQEQSL